MWALCECGFNEWSCRMVMVRYIDTFQNIRSGIPHSPERTVVKQWERAHEFGYVSKCVGTLDIKQAINCWSSAYAWCSVEQSMAKCTNMDMATKATALYCFAVQFLLCQPDQHASWETSSADVHFSAFSPEWSILSLIVTVGHNAQPTNNWSGSKLKDGIFQGGSIRKGSVKYSSDGLPGCSSMALTGM